MLLRTPRLLVLAGLLPSVLWWACTATVDLDGLSGGPHGGAGGSGAAGSGGTTVSAGGSGMGGMLGACTSDKCLAACSGSCPVCMGMSDAICDDPMHPRAQCLCNATDCVATAVCITSCYSNADCPQGDTCDLMSHSCSGGGVVSTSTGPVGDCCAPNVMGCMNAPCVMCACEIDPGCCDETNWSNVCASLAATSCAVPCNC